MLFWFCVYNFLVYIIVYWSYTFIMTYQTVWNITVKIITSRKYPAKTIPPWNKNIKLLTTDNLILFFFQSILLLLKYGTHLGFNVIKMLKKISLALLTQVEIKFQKCWNTFKRCTHLGFNAIRVLKGKDTLWNFSFKAFHEILLL